MGTANFIVSERGDTHVAVMRTHVQTQCIWEERLISGHEPFRGYSLIHTGRDASTVVGRMHHHLAPSPSSTPFPSWCIECVHLVHELSRVR